MRHRIASWLSWAMTGVILIAAVLVALIQSG
jgi:hypothetical protein